MLVENACRGLDLGDRCLSQRNPNPTCGITVKIDVCFIGTVASTNIHASKENNNWVIFSCPGVVNVHGTASDNERMSCCTSMEL